MAVAVRPARQKRSQQTWARITQAFEDLLKDHTFEEVTVAQICKEAGCSVGTLYGRVQNKEGLLEYARLQLYQEMEVKMQGLLRPERWADASLQQMLLSQLQLLVEIHQSRRGIIRAVIIQARRTQALAEAAQVFNQELMNSLCHSWLVRQEEIHHPSPERAVRSAFFLILGFLRDRIIFANLWPNYPEDTGEVLVEELNLALNQYLQLKKEA